MERMRAAANGQGEYNYIMRRTSKADNSGLKAQISQDTPQLEKDIKSTFKKSYEDAIKAGKSQRSASHEAAQKATGIVDAYWKTTLPKYGFQYVTPKKEYTYNGR